jgi:hypothetical protein
MPSSGHALQQQQQQQQLSVAAAVQLSVVIFPTSFTHLPFTHLHGLYGVLTWLQQDTLPLVAYAYAVCCLIPCLSFCPCPCPCWSAGLCAVTTVSICCVQYCALYGSCCFEQSVLCYQGCMLLLVGNLYNRRLSLHNSLYGGPSCIDWGSWQYCVFILCWVVVMHLFISDRDLPELTTVFPAACLLCTVQVPCYDVRGAQPCLHQQAWRVLAAPPPPGGGLLLTYCCACCVCV